MPRDWSDLFITAEASDHAGEQGDQPRRGFLRRLRDSMSRTRQALGSEIQATLFATLDEHTWERLEEALIMADVGAPTTAAVVAQLEQEASADGLEGGEALSERLIELLAQTASVGEPRIDLRNKPTVIMAVGVNGTGKTTTIGKLAWHIRQELGYSVGKRMSARVMAHGTRITARKFNATLGRYLLLRYGARKCAVQAAPVIGGIVGGAMDASVTLGIGAMARTIFKPIGQRVYA